MSPQSPRSPLAISRWVPPDDSSILPVTTTQLDDIILGRYKSAPPPSWKKWRGELVDAAMMIKDEARSASALSLSCRVSVCPDACIEPNPHTD
jgi:hypothetical protein